MTRYDGIRPPRNRMVATTNTRRTLRPGRSLRDSTKAPITVSTSVSSGPTTVRNTDTPTARQRISEVSSRRYASNVGSRGTITK